MKEITSKESGEQKLTRKLVCNFNDSTVLLFRLLLQYHQLQEDTNDHFKVSLSVNDDGGIATKALS